MYFTYYSHKLLLVELFGLSLSFFLLFAFFLSSSRISLWAPMHIGYDCERVTKSKFVAAAVYVLAPVAKYLHASVCGSCSYSFLEE